MHHGNLLVVSIAALTAACAVGSADESADAGALATLDDSGLIVTSPSLLSRNGPARLPGSWRDAGVALRPDAGHAADGGATAPEAGQSTGTGPPSGTGAASDASSGAPHDGSPGVTAGGLHASAGKLLDATGAAVHLHGVNHSGSEFACVGGYGFFDGPTDAASITAMKSWNINFVRVPLNEDCWLGINGASATYSGSKYQAAIKTYVDLLVASGIYVSLDLHWNAPGTTLATGQEAMADADHAPAFWTSVATAFKGSGSVIFELYNEPWPDGDQDTTAAWTCWRDGGSCGGIAYPVAGMQSLVDAVRATGATNFLLLGGVEYSNALSQWVAFRPTDPLNNLGAAWHVYKSNACASTSCFDAIEATVAASFPIVATEVGDDVCDGAFPTTVMQWLDAHGQGYAGWTWNAWGTTCGNYSLVTDTSGTPNGAYGQAFKTHFLSL